MVCSLGVSHTSSLLGSKPGRIETRSQIGKEVSALFFLAVENQGNCTVCTVRYLDLELKEKPEMETKIS